MSAEHVIALFTDIVGSTELSVSRSPDEADEVRRRHFSVLRRAIDATERPRGEEPRRRAHGRLRLGVVGDRLRGRDAAGGRCGGDRGGVRSRSASG